MSGKVPMVGITTTTIPGLSALDGVRWIWRREAYRRRGGEAKCGKKAKGKGKGQMAKIKIKRQK